MSTDYLLKRVYENKEFMNLIDDIINNDEVKKMKNFRQHYEFTLFDHCLNVSYVSYVIAKFFNLDYISIARGSMLHDFFLYDWREPSHKDTFLDFHAFLHPRIALENSLKYFDLNEKEKDIIIKHMWPVTLFRFPKYIESFIVTIVDKISAIEEGISYYRENVLKKKSFRYLYVFLSLLFTIELL